MTDVHFKRWNEVLLDGMELDTSLVITRDSEQERGRKIRAANSSENISV